MLYTSANQARKLTLVENLLLSRRFFLSLSLTTDDGIVLSFSFLFYADFFVFFSSIFWFFFVFFYSVLYLLFCIWYFCAFFAFFSRFYSYLMIDLIFHSNNFNGQYQLTSIYVNSFFPVRIRLCFASILFKYRRTYMVTRLEI